MAQNARKTWAERVRLWKTSDLTAEQFVSGRGFTAGTLRHWSWRLGAERRGWKPGHRRTPPVVEISLANEADSAAKAASPSTPQGAAEPFEVFLREGRRIRVPVHFDPAALMRLLSALEAR